MDEKTLTALQGSIKKWEKIVSGKGVDRGTENCPLCAVFLPRCDGCPVKERTGRGFCYGSPYDDFSNTFSDTWGESIHKADTPKRKRAALKELKFLKSLLP